jgi:outer membrane protein OmpU
MKHEGKTMKKVLFATTALVATAGVAAADITLSGSAEMGIAGASGNAQTTFHQSVDVRFSMSGSTDNGLSFGAVVDLDDVGERGTAGTGDIAGAFADFTVFVSGDFGRLTMGDTDGAVDWANDEVNTARNAGSIGDNETGHSGYFGGATADGVYNGQVLRYDYSVAGFGFAVSAEVDGSATRDGDAMLQIGLTYDVDFAGGQVQFGLGYGSVADANRRAAPTGSTAAQITAAANAAGNAIAGDQGFSVTTVSALVALDMGFSAAVNFVDISDDDYFLADGEFVGVGFGYEFGAITVSANFGEYDWGVLSNQADTEGYGLAASYDLGGGLSAHVGYGESEVTALNASNVTALGTASTWSLGLAMSF